MKLLKLELLGFKSFCERTVFHFNEGITSIVGPNGCGKSNIVDAIIWTLGERGTKALRIKDMEDVIFHGSDGRRAVNIAEVTLFFADDRNEYSVRRRIFRDGTNEYFLNGKVVRLKDIQDFFLGTGIGLNAYAIIEQGRIEAFVQMKPHERKVLIDEAGGITRFKEKKEDAIVRLEEVRANLERVEDIYREVQKTYKKAELEWERWKKYKELSEKKRIVERDILLEGYMRIKRSFERAMERLERLKDEIEKKRKDEKTLEESLKLKEQEISLNDKTINDIELKVRTKEKDVEATLKEIDHKRGEIFTLSKRLKEAEEKLKKTEEKISAVSNELKKLSLQEGELSSRMEKRSKDLTTLSEAAQKIKREINENEVRLEEKRTELFGVVSELTEINNKIAEIERKKREIQEREKRMKEEKEALERKISSVQEEIKNLKIALESRQKELVEYEKNADEQESKAKELKDEILEKEKMIGSLKVEKKAKEEYLKQLGHLKEEKEDIGGLKRLLEVIRVNAQEEAILEKYFARELECYLIEETKPEQIAEYLKKSGNYIFFPKRGIFKRTEEGVVIELRRVQNAEKAIEKILEGEEGVFITDDVLIDSRGLILKQAGSVSLDLKAEKEKRRVKKEVEGLEERLRLHSKELINLEAIWNKTDAQAKTLREKIQYLKKEIENIGREIWIRETALKEETERLKKLMELKEIDNNMGFEPDIYLPLSEKKEALSRRKQEVESEIITLKTMVTEKRRSLEELTERLRKEEIEMERERNSILRIEADRENKERYLKELKETQLALVSDIHDCKTKIKIESELIEELERNYNGLRKECEFNSKRMEELKIYLGSLREEKETILNELKEKRKEIERAKTKSEGIEKEVLLLSEKMNQITDVLRSAHEIDPEKCEMEIKPLSELEEEKATIDREIDLIGEINFRAEKEYYELKERIEFLEKQKEDLKVAMESLKRTISKIDSVSRDIFFETLDRVNGYYKSFISRLFLGGEGYLKYNADTDGVEMFAQPQGKKITRMEMLSGGEKALASVALLLALIETNPPPFCFMDEIDAPLDDANLMYLLEIIKDLSKKTQIVFITHNRLTMEVSGTIYGITMEKEGVSKVVSVRLVNE